MNNSHFRRGSSVYTCNLCGVRTRETGHGESGCELCKDCFELCGIDNELNDDNRIAEHRETILISHHLSNIASKGGSIDKVRAFCRFLYLTQADCDERARTAKNY